MAFQRVPAGNGVQWLTEAVQLILKNPLPFLLMGLLLGVISMIPLLGGLTLLILGPALYGGIMYAANEQSAGRAADFAQLFQAFREPGKIGRMLMLCLPMLAAGVVLGILFAMFLGGAMLSAGLSAANNSNVAIGAGIGGAVVFGLLAFVIVVAASALTFFATPRVMLENADAIAAMKDSLQACMANAGAFVICALIVFGATVVLGIAVGWIPLLGSLLVTAMLLPVAAVAAFVAWRQVYRHDVTQEIPPVVPPMEPPAPPAA